MNISRASAILFWICVTSLGLAADSPVPVLLEGHSKEVSTLTWSADGSALMTASDDRTIRKWDPITGHEIASLTKIAREGYGGPVVAISSDLNVAAINYWGEITIRTLHDNKEILKIDPILDRGQKAAFRPDVFAMAFSPDGKQLATAGSVAAVGGSHGLPGGIVIVWDSQTGKIVHKSDKLSTAASSVTWSSDGKRYAAGTNGAGGELPAVGEVKVWDAQTGTIFRNFKIIESVDYGGWASAGDVTFAPDGNHVAATLTAGSRGSPAGLLIDDTGASVRVWNLETGRATQPVKGLKESISRIAFSPDSKRLATAGKDKTARIWDIQSEKMLAALPCSDRVTAVAFSPDGKSLASGCFDGSVRIWPASTGIAVPPLKVFILAGQSNMEGQAVVDLEGKDYNEGKGTLKLLLRDPEKSRLIKHLTTPDGNWVVRNDVWCHYEREHGPLLAGPLAMGFSVYGDRHHFGPELQIGHVLGDYFENPVLLIKTAWGGKSLNVDFRPPSSGGNVGPYYKKMVAQVHKALDNLKQDFPGYDGRPYELSGFFWYHGWNDGVDPKNAIPNYEQNLVNLIHDVRKEFGTPNLPVVIGELTGPWVEAPGEWNTLRTAQRKAASRAELQDNVLFVETHDFVRKPEDSPNPTHGHHEFGNAETYFLVGDALGRGMVKLLKSSAN